MPAVIAELEIPPDQVALSDTLSQFEERLSQTVELRAQRLSLPVRIEI